MSLDLGQKDSQLEQFLIFGTESGREVTDSIIMLRKYQVSPFPLTLPFVQS
jgi:hypothetical protein